MSGHNNMLYKYYMNCSGICVQRFERLWRFYLKFCNVHETKWTRHVKRDCDIAQWYISSANSLLLSSLSGTQPNLNSGTDISTGICVGDHQTPHPPPPYTPVEKLNAFRWFTEVIHSPIWHVTIHGSVTEWHAWELHWMQSCDLSCVRSVRQSLWRKWHTLYGELQSSMLA